MKKSILAMLTLLAGGSFLSCTEGFHDKIVPVDIAVENLGRILVINAKIEQDSVALVQIGYSEDIDAAITTPALYEQKASVTLTSSKGPSETLAYFKNGWYYGKSLRGAANDTYTLTIKIEGRTYTATSTMRPAPGFRDAWVSEAKYTTKDITKIGYSEQWRVLDPVETRDRYLFEWWRNGVHDLRRDWSIDDDRVVNVEGSLRLSNPTTDPLPNDYTVLRAARIDKGTYDYYNMYEKIVRGIVGVTSQTPYNPVSSFGPGTIGNFRAVAFSSIAVLTPPSLTVEAKGDQNAITFDANRFFKKYRLYYATQPGVTAKSDAIEIPGSAAAKTISYSHALPKSGAKIYYRIQAEDAAGNVSILSPETNVTPGK